MKIRDLLEKVKSLPEDQTIVVEAGAHVHTMSVKQFLDWMQRVTNNPDSDTTLNSDAKDHVGYAVWLN